MTILYGEKLAREVRKLMDAATQRMWVASPFVGPWGPGIRKVLGVEWKKARNVRLLTDIVAGHASPKSLELFSGLGAVKSLTGLHAKLYVGDDRVILASANLSQTAFERRYEVGLMLSPSQAKKSIAVFEQWWKKGKAVDPKQVKPGIAGRDTDAAAKNQGLTTLWESNPDPGEASAEKPAKFGDWDYFVEQYEDLAHRYAKVQRIWPTQLLFSEVDALLNFLYHHQANVVSNKYTKKKPRRLSESERDQQIRTFARQFKKWYESDDNVVESQTWRRDHARVVQRLLKTATRRNLSTAETRELLKQTNAMNSYAINIEKVINNNSKPTIRKALVTLADDSIPVQRRLRDASSQVFGLGKSAVQELVAFNEPAHYPLRNGNSNAGLRFFGYDVPVR